MRGKKKEERVRGRRKEERKKKCSAVWSQLCNSDRNAIFWNSDTEICLPIP